MGNGHIQGELQSRRESIERLRSRGCLFEPDAEHIPSIAVGRSLDEQAQILLQSPELIPFAMIRVPHSAELSEHDWNCLGDIREIQHLHIASPSLKPAQMAFLVALDKLEILVLRGRHFTDEYCGHLPPLQHIRMIDAQSTNVSAGGKLQLIHRFPKATVYIDE